MRDPTIVVSDEAVLDFTRSNSDDKGMLHPYGLLREVGMLTVMCKM